MNENKMLTIVIVVIALCLTIGLLTNKYMNKELKIKAIAQGCSVSKDLTVICPGTKSIKP